ncbi:MAG: hypothetical protein GY927_16895 [bacterium]|nr:hypothetical protein [bacterium]
MQKSIALRQKLRTSRHLAVVLDFIGVEILPRNYIEKALSTIGAFVAILAVYLISSKFMEPDAAVLIVASMGATAMLLFSLPHAAVSQPWPVLAGHIVSALIGVFVGRHIADPMLAAPLAVALCTFVMFLGRCVHPPGAATALSAVFAADGIRELGYSFALAPVALNAIVLLVIALLFNAPFNWRRYPSGWHMRPQQQTEQERTKHAISHADFVEAVKGLDTFIDVSEDDLLKLHNLITKSEASRRH